MKWSRLLLLVAVLVAVGAAILPVFTQNSNCGGNSAALAEVRCIALAAVVYASDAPDHTFRFTIPTAWQRGELAHYGRTHWCRDARFLVSISPIFEQERQQHRIITVCDKPYTNVPRQRFGSAPPTHAAGFSDGSCGLISKAEFAALDRTMFIPIDELYREKSR